MGQTFSCRVASSSAINISPFFHCHCHLPNHHHGSSPSLPSPSPQRHRHRCGYICITRPPYSSNFNMSSPSIKRQTSASLVMKRAPNHRIRRPTTNDDGSRPNIQLEPVELAANLRRPVVAKRATLGHVVPKNSKTRQLKSPAESGGSNVAQLRPQGQSRDTQRYNNPSNICILGGSVRLRKLASPHVYLRPMMGKVWEAV